MTSAAPDKVARHLKFRKIVLCLALSPALCVAQIFAVPDAKCKMLSVTIGAFQSHSGDALAKACAFVWHHWTEKSYGEFSVEAWSKQGFRGDSHYELELLRNGVPVFVGTLFSSRWL